MASGDPMNQLRQTLDDLSTTDLGYPAPDLNYYESVLRRLDFNVTQRTMADSDEAVRVISPEEWSLANQARAAADERQRELEAMQDHLRRVDAREEELKALIDDLQRQLTDAKARRDELVTLELVGVRPVGGTTAPRVERPVERPMELVEFEEEEPEWQPEPAAHGWQVPREQGALAWEETGQAPVPGQEEVPETWEPAPEDEPSWEEAPPEDWESTPEAEEEVPEVEAETVPDDAWQVTEPEPELEPVEQPMEPEPAEEVEEAWEAPPPRVEAPAPDTSAVEVEDEIRRIEDEIRKIEEELALIAAQERELESRGERPEVETMEPAEDATSAPGPYRTQGYTLFSKQVESPSGSQRPFYFFSKESEREDAEASELPEGYEVAVNPRTGMPYLKKSAEEA